MNQYQVLPPKIFQLTDTIETDYLELYRSLEENPLTLPSKDEPLSEEALPEYLNSLEELLRHHQETHSSSPNN
ncbi:MAG: hypothetical protein AAGE93_02360 [Bacteroidota bacterium]